MTRETKRARLVLGGLLTVSAMVAALLVPNISANAVAGAGGQNLTTNAPDLRTATLDSNGFVHYCYDGFVSQDNASQFFLVGMDSDTYSSPAASGGTKIDSNDPHCVLADFTAESAPDNFTRAYSYSGAATDSNGNQSADDSAPLQGTIVAPAPGVVDVPQLVHATVNTALNRISYYYDKDLNNGAVPCTNQGEEGPCTADNLGYYTSAGLTGNGTNHTGEATCTISTAHDHVTCTYPNSDNVSQAVAALDNEDGVEDVEGDVSVLQSVPVNTAGDGTFSTASPDLVAVTKVGNKTYDFSFDQNVTDNNDADFAIQLDDASYYQGDSHSQTQNSVVRVTFNGADDDPAHVARAFVYECAVVDTNTINQEVNGCNTADGLALSTPDAGPGVTDGPDLQRASYDSTNNTVTYTFDENVLESTIDPGRFDLISNTGDDFASGMSLVDTNGPSVTIGFDSGVAQAAGTVVQDTVGNVVQDAWALCDTVNQNHDVNDWNESSGPFDCGGQQQQDGAQQVQEGPSGTGNGNSLNAVGGGPAQQAGSPTATPSSTSSTTSNPSASSTTSPSPSSSGSPGPSTRDDPTTLTIGYNGGIFSGNAIDNDPLADCESGRPVQLHKKRRGHPGTVIGSDTTDGSGHYSIAHTARHHHHFRRRVSYWTTIDPKVVTDSNGDTVNCLTARSNTTIRR